MSRSGYTDEWDETTQLWRANVDRAVGGKRGQAFFRDLVAALDAMPVKRLIANALQEDGSGEVCALGSLAKAKGAALDPDDTEDYEKLGKTFGISSMLAQEVMYQNDEMGPQPDSYRNRPGETPEQRWTRIRAWAAASLQSTT